MMSFPYKQFFQTIAIYYKIYGGLSSLMGSPYFLISLILTILTQNIWVGDAASFKWYDLTLDIIPNLLGFTLGGYAILMSFGNEKFISRLSGKTQENDDISPFMRINGTFVHFIVLQLVSIIIAYLSKSNDNHNPLYSMAGVFFFSYALVTTLAATFAIMRISSWFDDFITKQRTDNMAKKGLTIVEYLAELNRQLRDDSEYEHGMAFIAYPEEAQGNDVSGYTVTGPKGKIGVFSRVSYKVNEQYEVNI